jgi:hypothetical protein
MSSKLTVAIITNTLARYEALVREAITQGNIVEVMEAKGAEIVRFFLCAILCLQLVIF